MAGVIHSLGLMDKLQEAGLLPDNCRRIIIDMRFDDRLRVYYEVVGDDRWCDAGLMAELCLAVKGANAADIADAEAKALGKVLRDRRLRTTAGDVG